MTFPIKKVFVFAILFFFLGFLNVDASTIEVDDTTGTDADNGLCSIVEAIANANNDDQSGSVDCTAGSGTDTISILTDISVSTPIGVTFSATPSIESSMTIDGNNHTMTNTANPLTTSLRFFESSGTGLDVSIQDMVFLNGDVSFDNEDGGAMYFQAADSTLTLENTTFSNNTAADGGVVYFKSTGSTNTLNISNSTFEDNTATNGGVFYILDGAVADITNSTFFNNTGSDGGVIHSVQSTGVANQISVNHSTSRGNTATGTSEFFYNCDNTAPPFTCPGAFSGVESYIFENSILDGCDGELTDATFTNILGDVSCGASGDVTNIDIALGDSGGPVETLALNSGSNAIDAGVAATLGCPSTDARGITRPVGGACDIGAFEFASDAITVTQSGGTTNVTEDGATDTFTIELENYPTANVTVTITDDAQINATPTSVTFLPADWPETKTVTVSAVDDSDDENDTHSGSISFSVVSGDAGYNNYSISNVSVSVSDNDSPVLSSGSSSGPTNPPPPPPPTPVYGCTDSSALNYNSSANTDNGSCAYPPVLVPGCMDSSAINYNSSANQDNGSCVYFPLVIFGCTDSSATNYNSSANENDGSCSYFVPEPILPVLDSVPPNSVVFPEFTTNINNDVLNEIVLGTSEVLKEIPKNLVDTLSVAGIALPTMLVLATQPAAVASIPLRLWNLIPTLLGFKRKKRPWGTVYDSVTKQPLDPVYVKLTDLSGREVATTITDIDGRFGFLAAPGTYRLSANKDNYVFPSQRLAGKGSDELYDNLYFQEEVIINNQDDLLIKNIPMDSQSFNWNEFEKAKNKNLMKFYSKRDLFFAKIASLVFILGIISSLVLMLITPAPINFIILGIYGLVLILRAFGIRPKKPGYVIEKETGFPLSFGIIKIFSAEIGREVSHTIIGKTGKYYTLVPNGEYYMQIMKKTGEDSYEKVFQTDTFAVRGGYIGKVFKI